MPGKDCDGSEFIDFLCSPKGEEIMQENSLSIHLETGNTLNQSINNNKKKIRHTKKINDKFSLEKLHSVNWQYFIEQIIRQVDKLKRI